MEILLNQTEIRMHLLFSDRFRTKRTSVWFQVNRKMVNTIWFDINTSLIPRIVIWIRDILVKYLRKCPTFTPFRLPTDAEPEDDVSKEPAAAVLCQYLFFKNNIKIIIILFIFLCQKKDILCQYLVAIFFFSKIILFIFRCHSSFQ